MTLKNKNSLRKNRKVIPLLFRRMAKVKEKENVFRDVSFHIINRNDRGRPLIIFY